jgi:hypothetical protein|tara:strand:- start:2706 stop:3293 length:588 start_codon:yes stop_codon:yes gene_type:complete
MSIIRADSIKNRAGNGAPDFPNGITVTGIVTSTVLDASVTNLTVTGNLGVGGTVTYEDVTNVDSLGVGTFRDGLRVTGICTATAFHGDGSALTGIDATALKDGSGNVIVQASSLDVVVSAGKTFKPATTNSTDLGTTNERWRVIYTNDLELSNKGSQNSVDGTWGDWTLQEGETDIFMINNRTGKKFKINMTEVD